MSKYDELVKALHRCSADDECAGCPYWHEEGEYCYQGQLARDAAAAIEELDAEETRLLLITSELQDKVVELEAEVERLQADVDAAYAH